MSFVFGSVLFLLGGFFGMLAMAFAVNLSKMSPPPENHPVLKAVRDDN
jgi:hypothetical protein